MLIINVEIKDFYKIKGRVQCFVQVFGCGYLCKVETGKNLAIAFFSPEIYPSQPQMITYKLKACQLFMVKQLARSGNQEKNFSCLL